MNRIAILVAAVALVAAVVTVSAVVPQLARTEEAGAPGIGDAYFPQYGNGGYDVDNYRIEVAYLPATDRLTGRTTITGTATQSLASFHLDFLLEVEAVTVNGEAAAFRQYPVHTPESSYGGELEVTPAKVLPAGAELAVTVEYADAPLSVRVGGFTPWIASPTGAVAQGEAESAAWWFPSNDHPLDKATYDILITTPTGLEGLSNGRLIDTRDDGVSTTWTWRVGEAMAPYLSFLAVGDYSITQATLPSGATYLSAVEEGGGEVLARAEADLARTPEVIAWLEEKFGPYPFEAAGGVVVDQDYGECCGLETQTRPVYPHSYWLQERQVTIIVHEVAHQWFGDSVSLTRWSDIWLNEGPALYAEWLWEEEHGGPTAQSQFDAHYADIAADDPFWTVPVIDPGADDIFHDAVYVRGAMTLHALKNRIGSDAFYAALKAWTTQHRHGYGTLDGFRKVFERLSGEDLSDFFLVWTKDAAKPPATVENGFLR